MATGDSLGAAADDANEEGRGTPAACARWRRAGGFELEAAARRHTEREAAMPGIQLHYVGTATGRRPAGAVVVELSRC